MVIFEALGEKYSFPENLSEVSLGQFIQYCELENKYLPSKMKELILLQEELAEIPLSDKLDRTPVEEKIETLYQEINSPDYKELILFWYSRIISFWTGLKYETIIGADGGSGMNVAQLKALALKLQELVNTPPEEVEYTNVIEHEGVNYFLPSQYMKEGTVVEYLEASQMYKIQETLAGGQWSSLAKVICILLRKEGEKYSKELLKREELFLRLPMSKAYKVAFFLLKRMDTLKSVFLTYTQAQIVKKLELELKL
jgi:hypothetical protein